MTAIVELVVNAEATAWQRVGFDVIGDVGGDATVLLGRTRIRLQPIEAGAERALGMSAWTLAHAPDPTVAAIDGLRTTHDDRIPTGGEPHPNGVSSIDHVVVNTPDLDRTCAALALATGAPLKRVREAGQIRQGFHRLDDVIVEVVTFAGLPDGPAAFWGLAVNVVDIGAIVELCGVTMMSPPKNAVQTGRRIASFRREAELGIPVAVMTGA